MLAALEFLDGGGVAVGLLAELAGEVLIEDVVGEGGLAGTGDAGEAEEEAEREIGVEFPEVVAGGSADLEELFGGLAAGFRDGDGFLAGEPGEGAGRWIVEILDFGFASWTTGGP